MLSWIIQVAIVSIIFIVFGHHLLDFLRDTLTIPKVKDIVPNKHYYTDEPKNDSIAPDKKENITNIEENSNVFVDSTPISDLDVDFMRNELKTYLKELKEPDRNGDSFDEKIKITDLL